MGGQRSTKVIRMSSLATLDIYTKFKDNTVNPCSDISLITISVAVETMNYVKNFMAIH